MGERKLLQSEIGMSSDKTTAKPRGDDWQSQFDEARIKLERLDPKIKT